MCRIRDQKPKRRPQAGRLSPFGGNFCKQSEVPDPDPAAVVNFPQHVRVGRLGSEQEPVHQYLRKGQQLELKSQREQRQLDLKGQEKLEQLEH